MSHNPTYDPEPGYYEYDRSGHSTPPKYYNPAPQATDQFSNMASYRQATSGPPQQQPSGDPSNGKSYRYATEAIPEDGEDEADYPPPSSGGGGMDSSRQVQFSNGGEPTKRISGGYKESAWDKYKFYIVALLALVFAILWVIFLGLYIHQVTLPAEAATQAPQTGEVQDTTQQAITTQGTTESTTIAPTTVPVEESDIGEYPAGSGSKVRRYILKNSNDMEVELISLGARINSIKYDNREIVPGFTSDSTATANLTEMAKSNLGSANGRICGEVAGSIFTVDGTTYTLEPVDGASYTEGGAKGFYQMNFEAERTADGVKFTRTVTSADDSMPSIDVEVMYTLDDDNQLKVVMNAMNSAGNTVLSVIDMCNSIRFNLDGDNAAIKDSHTLQVFNDLFLDNNGAWVTAAAALSYDFSGGKLLNELDAISAVIPTALFDGTYRIPGATGLKNVATLQSSASRIKMTMHSNQDVVRMTLINDDDFELNGRVTYEKGQFIGLITHAQPGSANSDEIQRSVLLKDGAMYEHVSMYKFEKY